MESMDEWMNPLENDFVSQNFKVLEFKRGYTNSSVISFCGRKGIRIDRVLVCEVLENAKNLVGSCLSVGY